MRRSANNTARAHVCAILLLSSTLQSRAAEPQTAAPEQSPSVEEILSSKPTEESYEREQRCVHSSRIRRTEILSDELIVLHLKGDEKLLLQFPQRCPGLRRDVTLRYEKGGTRICEHDTVQAMIEIGTTIRWGPRCILPAFELVNAAQVEYLKAELRSPARSSAPSDAPTAPEATEPAS